jgi:Response regulators consisting of a CheY-like receiver domain and a winged-helix DNA-binding domain
MSYNATKPRLLIVEDDTNLSIVVKDYLTLSGFDVTLCDNGKAAWETFTSNCFDLCVLDVMLPEFDGFTLAEKIRQQNTIVPILFLTAKADKEDKIKGFKLGADDYIVKPFNIEELVLRIEVFLKRSLSHIPPKELYSIGSYSFDYPNLSLMYNGCSQKLTQREADVLRLLCQNLGKITKREEILIQLWGEDDYFLGRSLDVFISKLRRYLKHDPDVTIVNHHGVGFQLNTN